MFRCRCPVLPSGATETVNSTTEGNHSVSSVAAVLYKLNLYDADEINRRRSNSVIHCGNEASEGQVFPAFVVADWGGCANLQVLLDGNDSYWATSRGQGDEPGQWSRTDADEPDEDEDECAEAEPTAMPYTGLLIGPFAPACPDAQRADEARADLLAERARVDVLIGLLGDALLALCGESSE